MTDMAKIGEYLERIATALERQTPQPPSVTVCPHSHAFVWQTAPESLLPISKVHRLPLDILQGIDRQKERLLANTLQFAQGLPANNALLWGARGTGKSSLIKAVHHAVNEKTQGNLALVEIQREDIPSLPRLLRHLAQTDRKFLIFCDDLSFENQDESYKCLKSVLDGGVEGRPDSVLFYATSNRRHLMSRQMIENERAGAIHQGEAVEEKVSLSDRFGLWIGFHNMDQRTYLDIIDAYAGTTDLSMNKEELHAKALEWSVSRGARSGRVAWQFFTDICGQNEIKPKL